MKLLTPIAALAAALVSMLAVAPAQALLSRTCVSAAKGNDANAANSCDCSTPCRSFQVAHDNTADQGELTVVDPGGYGALMINKSISVMNDGAGEASMLVSGGGTGITINASAATGYVNLRGITIQGVSGGTSTGLRFNSGVSLTVTNCFIRNHTGNGIEFFPNGSSQLSVSGTVVTDNGGHGIMVQPSAAGLVKAVFSRVESYNNSKNGFLVSTNVNNTTIRATAEDSVAGNNGLAGFLASINGGVVDLFVSRSVISNNGGSGLLSSGVTAHIRVGRSTITSNNRGLEAENSFVDSYGDNIIDGNTNANINAPGAGTYH